MAGRGETSGQTGLPFDWFSSDVLNHLQQSRPSTRPQGRQTCGTVARAADSGGRRRLGFRIRPERNSERADSGSCSAATGGRGEAGHLAKDPRCPLGHQRHGAV